MSGAALGTAASGLLGTLAALVFVLALAWGALRLLRRWQDRAVGSGGVAMPGLRFVRALPVGQRERVVVIEVEGERLLIGVAAGSVSLLGRVPSPSPSPPREAQPGVQP